ncbi:putative PfkB family kinase [Cryphonectria parasitica EP155]|uniref:PfkB family kinase n=1 Tax=Cryphonectria parasitica (strain ATCC 38755 / EP155) TaxID=660469 RepID=A0A9P4YD50_CRYP1|nr:putative PfkB family kinase [Cryphonectria parasitica EP155]KAF3770789.1 putative PfkB family kinase [Cryphonectria parasitica EP155]
MKHLIMVGACYLDTILTVPHFPEEDAKLRATSLKKRRGGNCGNSLEVLQQLVPPDLVALHLVTVLPSRRSAATETVLSSFGAGRSAAAVDFSQCIHREDQTEAASSFIVRSQATGSRTIVNHNELAEMTVDEFVRVAKAFEDNAADTWWHFEGRIPETTDKCIQHLRHHLPQSRVSVEVERPGREGLRKLAMEADVVFYSRTWAEGEGYATAGDCLMGEVAPKASLLLSTWGARGACAITPPSREVLHVEPVSDLAVQIVDAVGAGDTFIAGVMYGLLCRSGDWDVENTVRFAVDLATTKIQQDGFEGLGSKRPPAAV